MFDWLDRQRQKPKDERVRVAFTVALLTTIIIALLWMFTLPARLQEFDRNPSSGGETDAFNDFNEMLESGRNNVENAINSAQQQQTATGSPDQQQIQRPRGQQAPQPQPGLEGLEGLETGGTE